MMRVKRLMARKRKRKRKKEAKVKKAGVLSVVDILIGRLV